MDAHIAVLHTKVDSLIEKQKELTSRVRANEKVVAAITLLGTVALAVIGAGYFAPSAEACSPPRDLDGNMLPFTCPPHDTVILEEPKGVTDKSFDEKFPDAFTHTVTLYDTRVAHMGHSFPTGEWIQKMRDYESQKDRISIEEMLNNTLTEYEYGSDGSTESEELLQLSSDGDQQSFGWGYDRRDDRSWFRSLQEGESESSRSGHTREEDS